MSARVPLPSASGTLGRRGTHGRETPRAGAWKLRAAQKELRDIAEGKGTLGESSDEGDPRAATTKSPAVGRMP